MNRKQWFVLGIGLFLIGILFSQLAMTKECTLGGEIYSLSKDITSNLDNRSLNSYLSDLTSHDTVLSCFEQNTFILTLSKLLLGLGVIFVIIGYLEPKPKIN